MTDELTERLLAMPVGPSIPARQASPDKDFTRKVQVTGDVAEVEVRTAQGADVEGTALAALEAQGLDAAGWTVTGFRSSEWTMANGELGVSTRFTFARTSSLAGAERPALDELFAEIKRHKPRAKRAEGEHGAIVAIGDMQFGKIDGDGVEGTLRRTIGALNEAADVIAAHGKRFDIGHVHIAWLGDHIEGFNSQGGANVWRTVLTLSEQIRLTRRVMLHGLTTYAPQYDAFTMAAVPGNHGETVRFAGKGITRYDDSHDTESLIAVADAAALNPEAFGHVGFYVPDVDNMTVTLPIAGTVIAHAHGHQWKPGKHFEWWRGQGFHDPALHSADVLLAGHLHHFYVDTDGARTFVQPPSMESESTWWRHNTGTTGDPGLVVAIVKAGRVILTEVVR